MSQLPGRAHRRALGPCGSNGRSQPVCSCRGRGGSRGTTLGRPEACGRLRRGGSHGGLSRSGPGPRMGAWFGCASTTRIRMRRAHTTCWLRRSRRSATPRARSSWSVGLTTATGSYLEAASRSVNPQCNATAAARRHRRTTPYSFRVTAHRCRPDRGPPPRRKDATAMPKLDVDGVGLAYDDVGRRDGVPLVFIHGWTANRHRWDDQLGHFAGGTGSSASTSADMARAISRRTSTRSAVWPVRFSRCSTGSAWTGSSPWGTRWEG